MNVLLLASHAVAEYDDTRMFHDLGYEVFTPGGYEDPRTGTEGIRPPLPQVPYHADLAQRCREQREAFGEPGEAIDWAKAHLHDDVIDWADVIIVHHFPRVWIGGQWDRIRHKRVIWRTCGQSDPMTEEFMSGFPGLEIVRYSPKERVAFEAMGHFAGQDALIRFGKYPDDYGPWAGDWTVSSDHHADANVIAYGPNIDATPRPFVANVTQDMKQRGDATGYDFWQAATEGVPAVPAGKGSNDIHGLGALSYERMLQYLAGARAYLYTGTRPASYTLGLIEAMLSGVPIVSIGAQAWGNGWDGADLFEADEIVGRWGSFDRPDEARDLLRFYLDNPPDPTGDSARMRKRAIELFDVATVGAQWREFLS